MKNFNMLARLSLLATCISFSSAEAQIVLDLSPPAPVNSRGYSVKSVTFNGTGCPVGKNTAFLLQGNILWLKLGNLKVETGPGLSLSASRRNCAATVQFVQNKTSVAVDSIAYFLDTDLPAQTTANLSVSWFFQGEGQTGSYTDSLQGDYAGTWLSNFDAVPSNDVWEPCGVDRALTVNSAVRLSGQREQKAQAQWQIIGLRLKSRAC